MEELKIKLSAELSQLKKDVKDASSELERFRMEQSTKKQVELKINIERFSIDLKTAQSQLKEAIKTGNEERQMKLGIDIVDLQAKTKLAKNSLKEVENSINEGAYKQMAKTLSSLSNEYKNLSVSGFGASAHAKELKTRIDTLSSAIVKADKEVGQFHRNVGNYAGAFSSMKNSIIGAKNELLALGSAFLGIQGASSVLKASMNFEKQVAQFGVLFGSAEEGKKILEELNAFAIETPFEATKLRDSAIQLKAYGFEARDIIPTMQKLGDISLGDSEKFSRLAYALGQVKSAGKLYGSELRQFTETGIPLLATLGEMHGKTAGEMRKMVEEGSVSYDNVIGAMERLTKAGGLFNGSMEAQSETLGGKLSKLRDIYTLTLEKFKDTKAYELLKAGVDTAIKAFPDFINGLGKVIEVVGAFFSGLKKLYDFLTTNFIGIAISLAGTIGVLALAVQNLGIAFAFLKGSTIVSGIIAIATSFWGLTGAITGATLATGGLKAMLLASGIGAVFLAIGGGIAYLSSTATELKNNIGDLQKEIDQFSASGFITEAEKMKKGVEEMKGSIGTFWDNDGDFQKGADEYIAGLYAIAFSTGQNIADIKRSKEEFGGSEEKFIEYLQATSVEVQKGQAIFNEFAKKATESFDELNSSQKKISFQEMIDEVRRASSMTDAQFEDWLINMEWKAKESGDLAKEINFAIAHGMGTEAGLKKIREAGGEITEEVYNSLVPEMKETINSTIKMQAQGVKTMGQLIAPAFKTGAEIMGAVNKGLNNGLPTLAEILNSAINGLKRFVGSVGDKFPQLGAFMNKGVSLLSKISIPKIGVDIDSSGNALAQIKIISSETDNLASGIGGVDSAMKSLANESSRSGGASKKASTDNIEAKRLEVEAIKREEEELKAITAEQNNYISGVEKVQKTYQELSKATANYYDELEGNIKKAKKTQEELTQSLIDYKTEQTNDATKTLAKKDIDLTEEKVSLETGLTGEKDLTKIEEIKKKILQIDKERAIISDFIAKQGTEEQFKATNDFEKLSGTEKIIAEYEEKNLLKEKEIQGEISKQERIFEINQKILDNSVSTEQKIIDAKRNLRIEEEKGRLANDTVIQESLDALGFKNLTEEEELVVVKQVALGDNLQKEFEAISLTQQAILDEKQKYFNLTEKIYSQSIDTQKEKTEELITQINNAIMKQQQLLSLRNSAKISPPVVNNSSTVNNNITQNISSQSEADYFATAVQKAK